MFSLFRTVHLSIRVLRDASTTFSPVSLGLRVSR